MMVVCYIHDKMYWYGEPSFEEWIKINEAFMKNMVAAVFAQRGDDNLLAENGDLYRSVTYYSAVDASPNTYFNLKKKQQLI